MSGPSNGWVYSRRRPDRFVGSFFLFAGEYLMTCTHVLRDALETRGSYIGEVVKVRCRDAATLDLSATVHNHTPLPETLPDDANWQARRDADIAILKLTPDSFEKVIRMGTPLTPAVLARSRQLAGTPPFLVYGPSDGGTGVRGRVTEFMENGRLLLLPDAGERGQIEGGFSGAAVLLNDNAPTGNGTTLGMCVQANDRNEQARMIPAPALYEVALQMGVEPNLYRSRKRPQLDRSLFSILKDWDKPLGPLRDALNECRFGPQRIPVLVASNDIRHYPGLFVRRVMYHIAAEQDEPSPRDYWDEPLPEESDEDAAIRTYREQVNGGLSGNPERAIATAIDWGRRGVYLPDVQLSQRRDRRLVARILAECLAAVLTLRNQRTLFTAIITTPDSDIGPLSQQLQAEFGALLTEDLSRLLPKELAPLLRYYVDDLQRQQRTPSDAVLICHLPPFENVKETQLPAWARLVCEHEAAKKKWEDLNDRARERIYRGQTEMTVKEWSKRYDTNQKSVLGP